MDYERVRAYSIVVRGVSGLKDPFVRLMKVCSETLLRGFGSGNRREGRQRLKRIVFEVAPEFVADQVEGYWIDTGICERQTDTDYFEDFVTTVEFETLFESVNKNVDVSWRPTDDKQYDDDENHLGDLLTALQLFLP